MPPTVSAATATIRCRCFRIYDPRYGPSPPTQVVVARRDRAAAGTGNAKEGPGRVRIVECRLPRRLNPLDPHGRRIIGELIGAGVRDDGGEDVLHDVGAGL